MSNMRNYYRFEQSYTNSDQAQEKQHGRWTQQEHQKFIDGLKVFGKNWKKVEEYIGTRTGAQIRSHAQKFFNRMDKLDKEKQKKGLAPEKESEKSEENLVPPKIDKPAPTTIKNDSKQNSQPLNPKKEKKIQKQIQQQKEAVINQKVEEVDTQNVPAYQLSVRDQASNESFTQQQIFNPQIQNMIFYDMNYMMKNNPRTLEQEQLRQTQLQQQQQYYYQNYIQQINQYYPQQSQYEQYAQLASAYPYMYQSDFMNPNYLYGANNMLYYNNADQWNPSLNSQVPVQVDEATNKKRKLA